MFPTTRITRGKETPMNTGNTGPAGQPASGPGPGEAAEATPPTINWPAWLEEYYQADQADRIAGRWQVEGHQGLREGQ